MTDRKRRAPRNTADREEGCKEKQGQKPSETGRTERREGAPSSQGGEADPGGGRAPGGVRSCRALLGGEDEDGPRAGPPSPGGRV